MERSEYLRRWSALHGGYDPASSGMVTLWLNLIHRLAQPLTRFSPDAVTAAGLLVALTVPAWAAGSGRGWLLVGAAAVLLSALLDSVDGAVAVLTGTASRRGFVLDSLADRISDGAYLVALWVLGAPGLLCVAAAGVTFLLEYLRARAVVAGYTDLPITVAERPTRLILAGMMLLGVAVVGHPGSLSTVGAAVWTAVTVVGFLQLLRALR